MTLARTPRYLKEELTRAGELGPGKRWLLITSAYHMPGRWGVRQPASLSSLGRWITARGESRSLRPFDKVSEGLRRVDVAAREWVGLLAYWLRGRRCVFPAPQPVAVAALSGSKPAAPPCRPNP